MSSYSATMITKCTSGNPMAGAGSFANIRVDGRLSTESAIEVARETFQKEASFKGIEYLGFAIEKTYRFVDYKTPLVIDNNIKAQDILFLL